MAKSPDAFRTISEVADWLGVQAHVLRFWESKFAQVKPIKRAGGRRYYRPADMLLLGGIKQLLHEDGMTIKGAQKLLREKGVAHVADLSQPLDDLTMAVIEGDAAEVAQVPLQTAHEEAQEDVLEEVARDDISPTVAEQPDAVEEPSEIAPFEMSSPESDAVVDNISDDKAEPLDQVDLAPPEPETPQTHPEPEDDFAPNMGEVEPSFEAMDSPSDEAPWLETGPAPAQPEDINTLEETEPVDAVDEAEDAETSKPVEVALDATTSLEEATASEPEEAVPTMPSFRARHRTPPQEPSLSEDVEQQQETPTEDTQTEPAPDIVTEASDPEVEPAEQEPLAPRQIDVPLVPPHSEIKVEPSLLSALTKVRRIPPEIAREFKPHVARLTRLRASMANARKDHHKD